MVHGQVPGGGSAGLVDLIDRYGEAIEADLLETYGVDLAEFYRGKRSPRQILRLLAMLPDTCRLQAHLASEPRRGKATAKSEPWREHWGWGRDRHMFADLWDAMVAVAPLKGKAPKYARPENKPQGTSLASLMPNRPPPT